MTARCTLYMVPWKFSRVPEYATATFPEIFNALLFRSILWMCVQNLTFVTLPVPEIIGGIQKMWAVPGYAHGLFSPKSWMGFCSDRPCECTSQVRSFTHSWDNSDWSFGGWEPQSWGRGSGRGSAMVPFERALVRSYRLSIVTFLLSLRVSEILLLARHFFPPHL